MAWSRRGKATAEEAEAALATPAPEVAGRGSAEQDVGRAESGLAAVTQTAEEAAALAAYAMARRWLCEHPLFRAQAEHLADVLERQYELAGRSVELEHVAELHTPTGGGTP
jgi:hypothetical protein